MRYRNTFGPIRRAKYSNQKVNVNGEVYDSKKEFFRNCELVEMEKAGEISALRRQVKFELLPAQREISMEVYKSGPRKGERKPGKIIEQALSYVADFVYYRDGKMVVEDTKGVRTRDYIIKRKLMLYFHGIQIVEI